MTPDEVGSLALHRFGLGPKRGTLARIKSDPKGALLEELDNSGAALISDAGLPSYAQACRAGADDSMSQSGMTMREDYRRREVFARLKKGFDADLGFVERLVIFWSNHFSMSSDKGGVVASALGQWERDVVRVNALGTFADLLLKTISHPAMICYLDNDGSIGPTSERARRFKVSYNENLAREILELHTLGTNEGARTSNYKPADVKSLALMLTGWSFVRRIEADNGTYPDSKRGQFVFKEAFHQPNKKTFLKERYRQNGQQEAELALSRLATLEPTAEKIATKLVRHFLVDKPTPELIDPIKRTFLDSGGDLKQVAIALINLPGAFDAPANKIRTPYEFVVAMTRAMGTPFRQDVDSLQVFRTLDNLQQPVWGWPTPDGFPDESDHWLSPSGVILRLDVAQVIGQTLNTRAKVSDAASLAIDLYGGALSSRTMDTVRGAGSKKSANLSVLFSSPEFHRR